ncbi:MAG: TonB-dependent receptor [Bacteroidetes bacterium]|nr:TonB-dependent receptor [Bacteroidota bacterium]MBM3424453.1 TonB-dependent receptor [Bacteroidota bacterium]
MKLFLGLFLVLSANSLYAQTTLMSDTLKRKNEVVVYGKGLPFAFSDRTSTIQTFDIARNRALPIRSVNEALAYVPGLDLRQRGVQGIQGDLSIRGGTFEQNLILINGFKLVDPQTGHHALNLPVLLTNVQNIEVYKSSGTRIFGQNAMTGAVNFVTQPERSYGVNMQLFGANFGGLGFQSTVSAPVGKLRQSVSFGYDKSNGYWYNSDHTNQQVFYDAALPLGKKQELKALLGYSDRAFGANGYYTPSFPDQWESTQMAIAGLSHQAVMDKVTLLTKASLRTHRDEFRLKRFDPAFYTNKHWSEVITIEETGKWVSKLGTTGFGGEWRLEGLNSTNLGERERTYVSGFVDHTLKLMENKLILVGNVHYFNLYMNGNTYQKFLPGFEAAYVLLPSLRIYGNIGQSYRAPTYTELFYQDFSNVGNANLQPEYATNMELGASYSTTWGQVVSGSRDSWKSKITIDASVYRRNTNNMIDWVRNATTDPWMPVNLSNVIFTGVESNINYRWNGDGKFMLREVSLGYNYTDASHQFADPSQVTQSRYAFSGLRNQLVGRITANLTRWVAVSVAYRGVDRVGGNAYSLLDAKIAVNPSRSVTVFVEGNNLANTQYVEAGYVQMPGRWFKAGLQIKMLD